MDVGNVDSFQILTWLHSGPHNSVDLVAGALLYGFGLVGALATLYFISPEDLPALGGQNELHELRTDLRERIKRQTEDLDRRRSLVGLSSQASELADLERLYSDQQSHLKFLSRQFSATRRSMWRRGIPLFVILGPTVAAMFAATVWQALLIGSVGPAALAALGARRDVIDVSRNATNEISALTSDMAAVGSGGSDSGAPHEPESHRGRDWEALQRKYLIALELLDKIKIQPPLMVDVDAPGATQPNEP